ncbi:MAG: hypothetical protein NZ693_01140 [Thermoflexales bacterium]|nr:hypothetical protein [Thermoflexales bacterium]
MNAWLSDRPLPLVIAHRGASAHAPENTLAAFRLAMEQGADGAELDVMCCASGEVVVIHDDTVDRTTNGRGRVSALSLRALKQLDAGAGERIPTLSEVLTATERPGTPFLLNIELKPNAAPRDQLEAKVVDLVRQHACTERVLFSSFNPLIVRRLARLAPEVPRAILYFSGMPKLLRALVIALAGAHEFQHPDHRLVVPEHVQRLRAIGKRVNTWTVNTLEDALRVGRAGVAGIIGDSPSLLRASVEALGLKIERG